MAPKLLSLCVLVAFAACGDDPKPDTAAPEVLIEAPVAGARVSDPVTVTGTAIDPKVKGRKTSGVVSVLVDDVAATVDDGRFSATLTASSPGERTITVVATDKAGNATTATVDVNVGPPITQLHVEPPTVALASATNSVQLVVTGFFEGSGASNITGDVTYESADPTIAEVDANGVVSAASVTATGTTEIIVRFGDLTASVSAVIQIDSEPPSRPNVVGYFPSANQRDQTWTGITEPEAQLDVTGAAAPVAVKADRSGRFWLNVPLVANRLNEVVLTLTDTNGNAVAFPFPVTQSDGAIDAGTLHFSSSRQVVGFVGELVPEQLAARAYTADGAPLAGATVTFSVMTGEGLLSEDGTSEARTFTTTTDAAGYARARWRLGGNDYGRVEVHAALAGDTGFPVVFMAEGFMRLEQPTEVEGVVYDENRVPVVGLPVTILAPGSEYASTTTGSAGVTDERGHFRIAYAPAIPEPEVPLFQHMRLDGTAMAPQKYVRIDRQVTVLPGQINDVGTFWIPRLPDGVVPKLDANGIVTEAFTLEREIVPGNGPVRVTVALGTKITWPGGVPEDARRLTLLTIPGNRAPMTLPDGFYSPEVLALQPGGTRFDPPLQLDLPNTNGAAPGAALTMWSYDHFQSEFVPIGRGIVSADGTRVVSEEGSGIRVGAWHQVSPPEPDPPCTAQGQTKTTVIKGKPPKERKPDKCKCYIEGTEQPTPCPEDADMDGTPDKFIVTNIPGCKSPPPPPPPNPPPNNPPPPKPPTRKVEVVCEEQALQITKPTEIISYVKRGETMQFVAECLDNHKSDGNITWQRSAPVPAGATPNPPKSGSGPRFTVRFDQEGRYVVSASANTKTCKGNDQRTVVVKTCVDMGVVRTCGDTIEQVGPTSDNRWKVSGNVRMGLKGSGSEPGSTTPNTGDLYLQVAGDMLVDAATAKPLAATTVHMEVGFPIVGTKLTPIIYQSEFTVDATGLVKIQPFAQGSNEGVAFRLMQFTMQFSEFQMLIKGIFLKNPNLEMFGRKDKRTIWVCNKPKDLAFQFMDYKEYQPGRCKPNEVESQEVVESKDLQIVVSGVEVNADNIIPNGYFEYKPKDAAGNPGLNLGSDAFQLTALKVGYEKNRFIGELGLQMNLKRMSLGIKTSLTIGEGYFSGELGVTFAGFQLGSFTVPGIPIVPVLFGAPVYLSSLGLGYESTSWPVSDTAAMKLTGKAGVTLGPTLDLLSKKVALATGALTMTMSPYPLAFGMKGELSLLSVTGGSFDSVTTETPMKLTGSFDVAFEPAFMVKLTGESSMFVPDLFGAAVTDPFYKGTISGQVSVLPEDGSVRGQMSGGVSWQIPKTKFTPTINVLSGNFVAIFLTQNNTLEASGSVSFSCLTYTCTMSMLHDPVNGLSVWMQTDKGDFVNLYGLNPNLRARQVAAPSLGVSAETAVATDYDGNPLNFELLEPASRMVVTLDKERGPVAGALVLPNGDRVAAAANPLAFANETGVDFDEGADGKTASWTVYGAEPGTYTYVGPNDGDVIKGVYAFVPAPLPKLVFDEPFVSDGGDTTISWTASGGSADATLRLLAVPTDPISGALEGWSVLTTVPLASGAFDIDESVLPYGEYRVLAEMTSQGGKVYADTIGTYTLGEPPEVEVGAPRYVRIDDGVVTWLPGAAAQRYVVTLFDDLGEVVEKQAVVAPGNRVRLALGGRLARGGKVMVDAQGLTGDTTSAATTIAVPGVVADDVVAPTRARVGTTWRYDAADAVVASGPAGVVVTADGVTWTPTEADIGTHDFVVRTADRTRSFVVQVLAADRSAAPESVIGPEGRVVAGVVGAEVRFTPEVYALDPVDVVIVSAPEGATLEAGEVRWTPTAADAIAGRGVVAIVLRATTAGLATDIKWVVRFADSDGDGLSDAWEVASELDPYDADSGGGDGDDDGVLDRDEFAAGTLAYVSDSDGDGIDDGDDDAPALGDGDGDGLGDGDEVGRGSDPAAADSDGDGIADGVEVANGTNPAANVDSDGDGLSDDREAAAGTNSALADSDGDGLTDRDEVEGYSQAGDPCWGPTNPLVVDSDGDAADDASEAKRCDGVTDPNNNGVDVDGDGLRSDYERLLGTLDGRVDTDGDGVNDAVELAVGTDPTKAESAPEGVETQANEPIANTGESQGLVLAPESLTDFGVIEVFPDADHDSANDAYEVQWDYDPASPADAYDDADGDLLPMWLESRLGTNPRAKDSDGDGVDDGVELQDGTDPNDPASVSSAGPVTAMTSYPRNADLQAHAFLGPVTLQLSVVGSRADGSTVDLTATARGTSYGVEPIAAGTVDAAGRFAMAPGFVGDAVVTVTNLALTTTSALSISTFTPGPVASLALPGAPTAIALGNDVVYVGGPWGLEVVYTSTIEVPVALGAVSLPASPVAFAADGSWVAAAMGGSGVAIVDVSDPAAPRLVAHVPTAKANGVAWAGGYALAATDAGLVRIVGEAGIGLVDADGDGTDDRIIDVQAPGSVFNDVARDLDRVVAARADGHMLTYRAVSGGLIQELDLTAAAATDIALTGSLLVGATGATGSRMVLGTGGRWTTSASLGRVLYAAQARDFMLVTESTSGTVVFLDARGAAPLTTLGSVDYDAFFPGGLVADERFFYLADGAGALRIGAHGALNDTLGVPPTVVPVAPLAGTTIEEGTRLTIEVAAHDDIGVKSVTLTRDGEDVVTTDLPPHVMSVKTTNVTTPTTMEIGAYANDFGGNYGEMAPLTFNVTPVDDRVAPTITLLEPVAEEWVAASSRVLVAVRPEDEHAIWKVEVRLDGALVATLEDPPYATEITMPAAAPSGRLRLEVTAFDYGENTAQAEAALVFAGTDLVANGVTTIAAADPTYDGQDILIRRGTVVIDGAHTFGKVRVGRDGVLTHSDVTGNDDSFGLDLECERVDVAPTGAIDVTGRGYLGDCAPGNGCGSGPRAEGNQAVARIASAGGSHGGVGGVGSRGTYGDWREPVTHGGGGNYGSGGGEAGGDGGGRIRILAEAMVLDGVLRANGANGLENNQRNGGGGAGGSVVLALGQLSGVGRIEANGGTAASGASNPGGPGGGGRVALVVDDVDFDLAYVRAWPGSTAVAPKAGAGTVYLDIAGAERLIVDDGNRSAGVDNLPLGFAPSDTPIVVPDLYVRGTSRLVLPARLEAPSLHLEDSARVSSLETDTTAVYGLDLDVGAITIASAAAIDVIARGYKGDCASGSCGNGPYGPGNVVVRRVAFTGGAHGGSSALNGHETYGSWTAPVDVGMGGNYGSGGGEAGGDGGGKVRIVADMLVVDGRIAVDGGAASDTNQKNGGGGAGGSIWVTATSITGVGVISADGGAPGSNTTTPGGAGAGGRVALFAATIGLSDAQVHAYPGVATGGLTAGAGSVWRKVGSTPARLVIDDDDRSGFLDNRVVGQTLGETVTAIDDLVVRGSSRLVLTTPLAAGDVVLEEHARLSHAEVTPTVETGLTLSADSLRIGADAVLDVVGRGYLGDCAGGSCGSGGYTVGNVTGGAQPRSGGSHGGLGGGASPNPTYGELVAPATLGAGGGYGNGGGEPGGDGGGRVRLVLDVLVVDGAIRADGGDALPNGVKNGSGGAGGSVWITTNTLSGEGSISANGGTVVADASPPGANGGGGRVAIAYSSGAFDDAQVRAWPGGPNGLGAAAGTIYLAKAGQDGRLILDDGGIGGADGRALGFDPSSEPQTLGYDLVLRGSSRLALARPLVVKDLVLEGSAVITQLATTATYEGGVDIAADSVTIAAGAAIDVSGRGYLGDCVPGDAACGSGPNTFGNVSAGNRARAGGSHGGLGGGASAHLPFGDPFAPTTLGGGGSYGSGGGEPGGNGGGRVRIVADRVSVAGRIDADGGDAAQVANRNGSGGAGGSIYITADVIDGAGTMTCRGGDGGDNPGDPGSGGGGGRIALSYTTLGVPLANIEVYGGGNPGVVQGGPGTVRLDGASDRLVVDGRGRVNLNETAPWVEVGANRVDLVNVDGVRVTGNPWLAGTLVGRDVVIDGRTFAVVSNTTNSLVASGALAGISVGAEVRGAVDARGSLEILGGARVALTDAVTAQSLLVAGAVLTHPAMPGDSPIVGLSLAIAGTATVAADGSIDVSERGYGGDCGAGDVSCGSGAMTYLSPSGARQFAGGSHAGAGGGAASYVFGDPLAPDTLGGGGGYGSGGGEPGGRGGGRVKLNATTLILDGHVVARGAPGVAVGAANGSGGAGGSVWLVADTFGGAGDIDASGGDAGSGVGGSGGGGGRVAVIWGDDAANAFDPDAIIAYGGDAAPRVGGPGTIYLGEAGGERLVVDNGGVANTTEIAPWVELGIGTVTSALSDRVTVANAGWLPNAFVGHDVVFGAGANRYTVVSNTADSLVFQASDGSVAGVGGQVLRGVYPFAGTIELRGGARVALLDRVAAEAFDIREGAVLTHAASFPNQAEQGLWLEISGALTIAVDGAIDASWRGYRGDCSAGTSCASGGIWFGNVAGGARQNAGGSFGGLGGGPSPNPVYGDTAASWWSGAGGGYGNGGGEPGGAGGGRVRLIVGTLGLLGDVRVDGQPAVGANAGGGAGGGVFITAAQLTGTGRVSATGGDGVGNGGGGGGGRVHIDAPGNAGTIVVDGGASGDPTRSGAAGTSVRD